MTDIKGFLEEADSIIKISKVKEKIVVDDDEGKSDKNVDNVDEKKKSKFSIMLEQEKKECPEGEHY